MRKRWNNSTEKKKQNSTSNIIHDHFMILSNYNVIPGFLRNRKIKWEEKKFSRNEKKMLNWKEWQEYDIL